VARTITTPIFIALVLLLHLSPPHSVQANEKIRHEVYANFAASTMDELTPMTNTPGFAVGYQVIPWRYLLVGAAAGYQAPARVDNLGLVYDLSLAEGMIYAGVRIPLDRLRTLRGADRLTAIGSRFLGANEFSIGATLGLSHYMQKVRREPLRTATHPFAGLYLAWNIWFLDWLGLHFNAMFHWNLTEVVPGAGGLMRKEIHLGPTFRF